jgi:hypothetical protein
MPAPALAAAPPALRCAARSRRRRTPPARPPLACAAPRDDAAAPLPPPSPLATAPERLRAALSAGGAGLQPFLIDGSLVAEDVRYEGPLASLSGREAYLAAQRDWAAALPARLPGWRVEGAALFPLSERALRLRAAPRFAARLPPRAAERLADAGQPPLPLRADGLVDCALALRADFEFDAAGRVRRHTEQLTDGYDVAATVARYEWLTARRRGDPPPLWYYKVLRHTSLEEAAAAAGTAPDDDALQAGFAAMVARNFGAGLLLGACRGGARLRRVFERGVCGAVPGER